ncbi:MAG: hypothetical protein AMJ90_05765 [candidate division Zixibacteria bacterium SM23_73_2]|nr:MAG: hypothetical protein AMJ90_05765 [candidate division Zixibacteria bacterium SM23_73_2]
MGKKKECPNCATEIPEESKVCYICGYEFPQHKTKGKVFWIAGIVLLILFMLSLVKFLFGIFR